MTFGAALLLIAVGAILRYAVTATVAGIDIQTVGLILIVIGLVGFVLALIALTRRPASSRGRSGPPPDEYRR